MRRGRPDGWKSRLFALLGVFATVPAVLELLEKEPLSLVWLATWFLFWAATLLLVPVVVLLLHVTAMVVGGEPVRRRQHHEPEAVLGRFRGAVRSVVRERTAPTPAGAATAVTLAEVPLRLLTGRRGRWLRCGGAAGLAAGLFGGVATLAVELPVQPWDCWALAAICGGWLWLLRGEHTRRLRAVWHINRARSDRWSSEGGGHDRDTG